MIAKTKHAIGIEAKNNAEILIHVGIDTVDYGGNGFETLKKVGDSVKQGEKILSINNAFFKEKKVDLTTPMLVTNSDQYHIEFFYEKNTVDIQDRIAKIS